MYLTTQRLAGMIAAHLPHRPQRRPVRVCTGVYFRSAVYRHGTVAKCPFCAEAPVQVEPDTNDDKVLVLPHQPRASVAVVTVTVVDR